MIRVARFSGPLSFYEEEGRNRTMELLKQRIRKDGTVKGNDVLKVDSFLNHQMDVALFEEIGKEFKRLYADCGVNKILTIEASGIGIACVTAQSFHCPVVFAKKSQSKNIDGAVYATKVQSFTHGKIYDVIVSKKFLGPEDKVLIIDDFLANGAALEGLIDPGPPGRGHPGGCRYRGGEGLPARGRPAAGPGHPGGVPGPGEVHERGDRRGLCGRLNWN